MDTTNCIDQFAGEHLRLPLEWKSNGGKILRIKKMKGKNIDIINYESRKVIEKAN